MTQIETRYTGYHIGIIFRKFLPILPPLGIRFQELTRQKILTDLVPEMIPIPIQLESTAIQKSAKSMKFKDYSTPGTFLGGFEPPASRLGGVRSILLSYRNLTYKTE